MITEWIIHILILLGENYGVVIINVRSVYKSLQNVYCLIRLCSVFHTKKKAPNRFQTSDKIWLWVCYVSVCPFWNHFMRGFSKWIKQFPCKINMHVFYCSWECIYQFFTTLLHLHKKPFDPVWKQQLNLNWNFGSLEVHHRQNIARLICI